MVQRLLEGAFQRGRSLRGTPVSDEEPMMEGTNPQEPVPPVDFEAGEPEEPVQPPPRWPRRLRRLVMLGVIAWLVWDTNAGQRFVTRVRDVVAWVYEVATTGEWVWFSQRVRNFRSLLRDVMQRAQAAADQGIEIELPWEELTLELVRSADVDALKRAALAAARRVGAALEAVRPGGPSGFPVGGAVSSGFGYRVHPVTGEWTFHEGVDIPAQPGTKVRATADGVVVSSDFHGTLGRAVILDHGDGWETRYGHLDELRVFEGERVRAGEVIGVVGRTGRATGWHVHYEVRYRGVPVKPRGER